MASRRAHHPGPVRMRTDGTVAPRRAALHQCCTVATGCVALLLRCACAAREACAHCGRVELPAGPRIVPACAATCPAALCNASWSVATYHDALQRVVLRSDVSCCVATCRAALQRVVLRCNVRCCGCGRNACAELPAGPRAAPRAPRGRHRHGLRGRMPPWVRACSCGSGTRHTSPLIFQAGYSKG
jgi:hypothetical protein